MFHVDFIFNVIASIIILAVAATPIVLGLMLLSRLSSKEKGSASAKRIEQLEQNDNIIVEDINTALSEIVSRLEAIEDRLDREDQTVKGFAKKSKQLND